MKSWLLIPIFLAHLSISIFILQHITHNEFSKCGNVYFPLNLDDLKQLVSEIKGCYLSAPYLVYFIHMICFVFLQAWCIPGTVLFNLFGGAVFGVTKGFMLCLIVSQYLN